MAARSILMMMFLFFAGEGLALKFSRNGRYIPNVKIGEEIDVSEVTFTTPPTDSAVRATSNKQRMIVPVVTYHKVMHPHPGVYAPAVVNSIANYGSAGYKRRSRSKQGAKVNVNGDFRGHRNGGAKLVRPTAKHRGASYPMGTAQQDYSKGMNVRPVYYLIGDDANSSTGSEAEQNVEIIPSEKSTDSPRLYHEKELQFVKPRKKHPYPKKYSRVPLKKHNPKSSPDADGYSKGDGRAAAVDSHDEEQSMSENVANHQPNGQPNLDGQPGELNPKSGDRVEFQMYGMNGPHSYKFGYDTGKGDNRHFRFEERDSNGKVTGHYGYMDDDGKMRIMKYEADPETGFHAGPVDYTPNDSN